MAPSLKQNRRQSVTKAGAMHLETEAIIVAVRAHGEHGAIVRALTGAEGLQPGYVRGGKSRRLRPVLVPGNLVAADYRSRTEEQLAHLSVELIHSRAFLLSEPLASAGIEWATALTASALPEGQPYPRLFEGVDGPLGAVEAAPRGRRPTPRPGRRAPRSRRPAPPPPPGPPRRRARRPRKAGRAAQANAR